MIEVNIKADIHCSKPIWATLGAFHKKFSDSKYRVYVNDNLITERDWIWDNNILLQENLWIHCEPNQDYTFKIIPVVYISEQASFNLDNFKITNVDANINIIDDLQVNFSLR